MEDLEGHLQRHVLARVVQAVEQDLRLGLVVGDVVGDLDGPDVAALVGLADAREGDDGRMGGGDRLDLRDHLGVGVEALPAGRELVGGSGSRRCRATERHDGD